jgi:hypothetical protein
VHTRRNVITSIGNRVAFRVKVRAFSQRRHKLLQSGKAMNLARQLTLIMATTAHNQARLDSGSSPSEVAISSRSTVRLTNRTYSRSAP